MSSDQAILNRLEAASVQLEALRNSRVLPHYTGSDFQLALLLTLLELGDEELVPRLVRAEQQRRRLHTHIMGLDGPVNLTLALFNKDEPMEGEEPSKGGCPHIGKDGKCRECTQEETNECNNCDSLFPHSRLTPCKDEDCEAAYCDDCKDQNLDENGYCEDCREFECNSCNNTFPRESAIHCNRDKECKSQETYCKACAQKCLDGEGLCADCSKDEWVDCNNCDENINIKKVTFCKGNQEGCNTAYCPHCRDDNLDKGGYCGNCREFECDICGMTFPRESAINCKGEGCNSRRYCKKCARRLLNSQGECMSCSREDEITCDGCQNIYTKSQTTRCRGEDCEKDFCKKCAPGHLTNGKCEDCEDK
ncbi:MAG: hypothetical protein NUV97_01165 [archaeon]|nr:hypothetical protein [archaeon]MCR4323428.1 hypothetical protein [Nanoarchaeota archaeon]